MQRSARKRRSRSTCCGVREASCLRLYSESQAPKVSMRWRVLVCPRTYHEEESMPMDEIIIRLFCMVDDQLGVVIKRSDAHLYPSEIVSLMLRCCSRCGLFRYRSS